MVSIRKERIPPGTQLLPVLAGLIRGISHIEDSPFSPKAGAPERRVAGTYLSCFLVRS
ncbi:hypothetical protein L21SP2_0271 [Salinispira pacifica]|uniref:Uncharacterized protein n=1 Tax=Salinispira pacifica TaxID=1307761 RepID=V5WD18_9SPIO|nr:hypothetical protein L21SP2_0271 [Salinispira pacifica]